MQHSRTYNLLALLLVAIFGLTSLATCAHGPCDDDLGFSSDSDHDSRASADDAHSCGDCGDHEDKADSHLCPCLCHSPASIGMTVTMLSSVQTETVTHDIRYLLPKGTFTRIERPPKQS